MPEKSRYILVEGDFIKRAKGDDGASRMNNLKYAEGVVDKLLANPGVKIWYGAAASLVKFATSWFPTSWLVNLPRNLISLGARLTVWQDTGVAKGTGIDHMLKVKK